MMSREVIRSPGAGSAAYGSPELSLLVPMEAFLHVSFYWHRRPEGHTGPGFLSNGQPERTGPDYEEKDSLLRGAVEIAVSLTPVSSAQWPRPTFREIPIFGGCPSQTVLSIGFSVVCGSDFLLSPEKWFVSWVEIHFLRQ
jgi:hypothetical protein